MRKILLVALCCLPLGACARGPGFGELLKSKEQIRDKDEQTCASYGLKPGNASFGQCLMKQDEIRANVQAQLISRS
jgi:hypothetical protein